MTAGQKLREEGYAKAYAEGYAEGFAEGYAEGLEEGRLRMAELVLSLVGRAFGVDGGQYEALVAHASPAQLQLWGEAVLTASTPDEVFADAAE